MFDVIKNAFLARDYFRLTPHPFSPETACKVQRVAVCSLEVLSLLTPVGGVLSVGSDCVCLGSRVMNVVRCRQIESTEAIEGAFAVARISILFFNPAVGALLIPCFELAKALVLLVKNRNGEQGAQVLFNTLYLALMASGTPHLALASILFKIGFTTLQGYQEYQRGERHIEVFTKMMCVFIHLHQGAPLAQDFYYERFGDRITQKKWDNLIGSVAEPDQLLDVREVLLRNKFSTRLSHITFENLSHLKFKHLKLTNCIFSGEFHSIQMEKTNLCFCKFRDTLFFNSLFKKVSGTRCNFYNFGFIDSLMEQSSFYDTDLRMSLWFGSVIKTTLFADSVFAGASFLNASVIASALKGCSLIDAFFCGTLASFKQRGCTANEITKPVAFFPWKLTFEHVYYMRLNFYAQVEHGILPFRTPKYFTHIDSERLDRQVQEFCAEMRAHPPEGMVSIVDELWKRASDDSPIGQLKREVESWFLKTPCSGVFIPGDCDDVHPDLYGATSLPMTSSHPSYVPEMVDLALIRHALQGHIPLFTVCRGTQLLNVAGGGSLFQDVPDEAWTFSEISLEGDSPAVRDLEQFAGSRFLMLRSMHHQAIDLVASLFEIVFRNSAGVPKVLMNQEGTVLASQVHPEYYQVDMKDLSTAFSRFQEELQESIRESIQDLPPDFFQDAFAKFLKEQQTFQQRILHGSAFLQFFRKQMLKYQKQEKDLDSRHQELTLVNK